MHQCAYTKMRHLNIKQKKLLDNWYLDNAEKVGIFFDIAKYDEFSLSLLQELEGINDFETIIQEINNYISEKATKNWSD